MAWYNPFSWGGGPDEVDYSRLEGIINRIQSRGLDYERRMGNISFDVTDADRARYGESYGHMRDMVLRDLENRLPGILGQASGRAGARGLTGSGIEAAMRGNITRGAQRDAANVLSQFGSQQAGIMSQMAFQRGGAELSRNQAMWQTFTQAYAPRLQREQQWTQQEERRIASEKSAFGKFFGKALGIGAFFIPGVGPALSAGILGSDMAGAGGGGGGGGGYPAPQDPYNWGYGGYA